MYQYFDVVDRKLKEASHMVTNAIISFTLISLALMRVRWSRAVYTVAGKAG